MKSRVSSPNIELGVDTERGVNTRPPNPCGALQRGVPVPQNSFRRAQSCGTWSFFRGEEGSGATGRKWAQIDGEDRFRVCVEGAQEPHAPLIDYTQTLILSLPLFFHTPAVLLSSSPLSLSPSLLSLPLPLSPSLCFSYHSLCFSLSFPYPSLSLSLWVTAVQPDWLFERPPCLISPVPTDTTSPPPAMKKDRLSTPCV